MVLKGNPKLQTYNRWVGLSFTENNQAVKWCPNVGCNYGVQKVTDNVVKTVYCMCGSAFCFNCSKELHRPADCQMVV